MNIKHSIQRNKQKNSLVTNKSIFILVAPTITLYKETKIAQKYSIVMLECEFSGYPKPKIRYLKDNLLISRFNNSRVFPHLKVSFICNKKEKSLSMCK